MQVSARTRLGLRLQGLVFFVLFAAVIGVLAWLSTRYVHQADWTVGGRNSLSETSIALLAAIPGPVEVTAYASDNELLRRRIGDLIARYRRHKPDISLRFVDPVADPERARTEGIAVDGTLVVQRGRRSERLEEHGEQAFSNALQRVAREESRWAAFVEGHGERNPHGEANHDLGDFGQDLVKKGVTVERLNLAATTRIPGNTSVLVIASPQTDLLPGEVQLIQDYITAGGNLLWLAEPGSLHGLDALATQLGVQFLPGVVVDADTQLLGLDDPAFALVTQYPEHDLTRHITQLTLFPQAAALAHSAPEGWQATALLATLDRAWNETSKLEGEIRPDAEGERRGPLDISVAFTRMLEPPAPDAASPQAGAAPREQRVVVIGDGDFLSNSYLGNGGNLQLGLALVNWLAHDDTLISIPPRTAPDLTLVLDNASIIAIGFGFLIALPLALLASGFLIWRRRRRA
jgi:ABC-type uncharacterized transport system involved in gliding motility auxiliary subunit